MQFHHLPVLLDESLNGLRIRQDGIYVDATLGGGGHSGELLRRLTSGRLIGIDRDEEAIRAARERLGARNFTALKGNFHDVKTLLDAAGVTRIDGALLDLGVSSHQLDEAGRGFSYHRNAPLDMRMDRGQELNAETIVNEWDAREIARVLRDYGEENWAAHIARVIADRRAQARIETTEQLVSIIDAAIPKKIRAKDGSHPARRTFQALRIAVNDELEPLRKALWDFADLLRPGGRLCVISFHSLEDRIVKNTFREMENPCSCPKTFPVCVCGKKPVMRTITRKPIVPSEKEIGENARARSAALRVSEKLGVEVCS